MTITRLSVAAAAIALAAMTAAASPAVTAPTAQGNRTAASDQLVGGWSLASRVTTLLDGKVVADPGLAATPQGVLLYDRSGHVAAQVSRQGRTTAMIAEECREAEKVRGTDSNSQTILGYDAYFGTYTVDEKQRVVTHHLQSALFPGDIGKSIRRHFRLAGDVLTITFNTTLGDGTTVVRTLVWNRMK